MAGFSSHGEWGWGWRGGVGGGGWGVEGGGVGVVEGWGWRGWGGGVGGGGVGGGGVGGGDDVKLGSIMPWPARLSDRVFDINIHHGCNCNHDCTFRRPIMRVYGRICLSL